MDDASLTKQLYFSAMQIYVEGQQRRQKSVSIIVQQQEFVEA